MSGKSSERDAQPTTFSGNAERWAAVLRRDRDADGVFYYSVSTTGVYCRPSCPSRPARREHVAFHASPAQAEKAGFRPCRRCRPDRPTLEQQHAAAVVRACRLIEAAPEVPSLDDLAAAAGLSRFHFHRVFRKVMGITPRAYAAAHRAHRLHESLPGSRSVTEAIYDAGFSSSGRFYESAAGTLGMPARTFRARGTGETIRFAVGECALGAILVAATERGICAISLGDDPEALVHGLQDRFRNAALLGGDHRFESLVAQVVGFVEAPATGLDIPLDIRGTAFQQRVWQALQGVPPGATVSYAELAERVGAPGAARAVANACAANTLAVAIPCHRVIRTDGSLSGYRWGIARKRALLGRERRPDDEVAPLPDKPRSRGV